MKNHFDLLLDWLTLLDFIRLTLTAKSVKAQLSGLQYLLIRREAFYTFCP